MVVCLSLTCGCHDVPHIHLFRNGGFRAVVNSRVQYEEYNGACNSIDLFIYLETHFYDDEVAVQAPCLFCSQNRSLRASCCRHSCSSLCIHCIRLHIYKAVEVL